MNTNVLDWKRIGIYIAFAFGIAWLFALGIQLTGGMQKSPYTLLFLAVGYMGAPAAANILTRLVTREGWQHLYLRPRFKQGWIYWLICWISPVLFTFLGMAIFFVFFPQYFDPSLSTLQSMMENSASTTGQTIPAMNPWAIVISQTVTALLIAPILNALSTLGEEFGWRAYLQPKLMPLGGRQAMVWMGLVWGIWHAPIVAMGHNYGLNYPGAPWLGILATTWFMFLLGTFLGWAALRAGSVWPAVIGHGAINGIANIYPFFMKGEPNLILGPSVAGIIGSLGLAIVTLVIFLSPNALKPRVEQEAVSELTSISVTTS